MIPSAVEQFNALNGQIATRKELEEIAELGKLQGQNNIAKRIAKILEQYDHDDFEINLAKKAIDQVPKDCLPGMECLEPDEDFEGLEKAVSPDEIYQYITDLMLNTIKEVGHLPWQKEWKESSLAKGNEALNWKSKKKYRGINYFLLNFEEKLIGGKMVMLPRTFENPFFLTFNQIKEAKGKLKEGSKGTKIVYFTKLYKYEQAEPELNFGTYSFPKMVNWLKKNRSKISLMKSFSPESIAAQNAIPILKYYNVFSAEDVEGVKWDLPEPENKTKAEKIEIADAVIKNMQMAPPIKHGGGRAFYVPSTDFIQMPNKTDFNKIHGYYTTLFHEMVHSTGHHKRLDRDMKNGKKGKSYAFEELIAEMGAVYLCAESGILFETKDNSAKYLKGWNSRLVKNMEEDNRFFFRAASQAQAASDFILDRDKEGNPAYLNSLKSESKKKEKEVEKKPTKPKYTIATINSLKSKYLDRLDKSASNRQAKKFLEDLEKKSDKNIELKNNFGDWLSGKTSTLAIKDLLHEVGFDFRNNTHFNAFDTLDTMSAQIKNDARKAKKEVKLKNKKPKVGEQLGLFGADNQIKISTEKFNDFSTPELRAFILEYYNTFLKNKTLAIKNSLRKVELVNRAGRKISKGSAAYKAKTAVIEHFEEVLKQSTYNNWGEPKPKDSPDLLGYMNFKSKVNIDGKNRHVRISVEVFKDRKTLLKSYEVGKKKPHSSKESPKLSSSPNEVSKSGKKPLSKDKDNKKPASKKKGLKQPVENNAVATVPQPVPKPKPVPAVVEENPEPVGNPNSLAARMQRNKNRVIEYYNIEDPHIAKFLGQVEIKKKESVGISITAPQGAGKTRFAFQLINAFAKNYKVGHASMEEHPESGLYTDKAVEYIDPENLANIDAPDINSMADIEKLIRENDVIVIDSFEKLREMDKNVQVDQDFRKKYDRKLFIFIFQLTSDGKMRGGSKSQFDVDIVLFTEKFDDYRENYIYSNKNRYNSIPPSELKFSIYNRALVPNIKEEEPEGNPPKEVETPKIDTGNLIFTPVV